MQEARHQQDNEQWHLLLLEEWIHRRKISEGLIQQAIAFVYYHVSWLLYVLKPEWSHRFNGGFEDHAERKYMLERLALKDCGDFATPGKGCGLRERARLGALGGGRVKWALGVGG